MPPDDIDLPSELSLRSARPKQYPFELPLPVSEHLDHLLEAVHAAGGRSTRKELVAALIFGAQLDGEQLDDLLHRYRRAKVGDLLPAYDDKVVRLPGRRRPGPRAH